MGNYISTPSEKIIDGSNDMPHRDATDEPLTGDSSTSSVEVKPDDVNVYAKPTSEEVTAIVENINPDNEPDVATDATGTCSESCKCGPNCACSPCTCAADDDLEELIAQAGDLNLEGKSEAVPRAPTPDLEEISNFDRDTLKNSATTERNVLPSLQDIVQEKLPQLIEDFQMGQLKEVNTEEKCILPTAQEIANEKLVHDIIAFDQAKLHTSETSNEKHLMLG